MTTSVKSTNIELDRELLEQARRALNGASIKDTVEEGLRRVVAASSLIALAETVSKMRSDPEQAARLDAA